MRYLRSIILLLLICIIIIFIYYYFGYNRYEYLGKNAPLPTELHPIVAEKSEVLIKKAAKEEITVVFTESIRSVDRQNELYALGRTKDGNIVTYAKGGESYHNYGLAIDYVLMKHNNEQTWDIKYDGNGNGKSDWFEVAAIAKELGFEWGGDWDTFKDYPHLQMTFGLSISQLQRGLRPKADLQSE